MRRLFALAFAAWFIVPVHAEEWDWDIGYKRPGFVHHHHRNPHYVSDIDRERVRLYGKRGLKRSAEQSTARSVAMNTRSRMSEAFDAWSLCAG